MRYYLFGLALLCSSILTAGEQRNSHEKYDGNECEISISEIGKLVNEKNYYVNFGKKKHVIDSTYRRNKALITSKNEILEFCVAHYDSRLLDIYKSVATLSIRYETVFSEESLKENYLYAQKRFSKMHLELINAVEAYNKNRQSRRSKAAPLL